MTIPSTRSSAMMVLGDKDKLVEGTGVSVTFLFSDRQ